MWQKHYDLALEGKVGRAMAIKLKCLDCSGWQRPAVRDCSVTACPLWHVRPFQRDEEEE